MVGIDVSERDLCEMLGVEKTAKSTIHKALVWLENNEWIRREIGKSKSCKTAIFPNVEKVQEFVSHTAYQLRTYDLQADEMIKRVSSK